MADLCQFHSPAQSSVASASSWAESRVNNSAPTIIMGISLTPHNDLALLSSVFKNMVKRRHNWLKCVVSFAYNWSSVEKFSRWWLCVVCVCLCVLTVAIGISKVTPSSQHCYFWLRSHSVPLRKYCILLEMTGKFDRLENKAHRQWRSYRIATECVSQANQVNVLYCMLSCLASCTVHYIHWVGVSGNM